MKIWRFYFAFAFVMERQINSLRFSFAFAFVMVMLGTHKQQQQAILTKIKLPEIFFRFRFRNSTDRGQKRHINIWHINNFSVTPVTDPPGRVPDPPGRVPGRKCLCSLGSAHSLSGDPGHPVGRPPPHPGSHRNNLFMFMCLFLS